MPKIDQKLRKNVEKLIKNSLNYWKKNHPKLSKSSIQMGKNVKN